MKVFYPRNTEQHAPEYEVDNGCQALAYEVPARLEAIRREIENLPFVSLQQPQRAAAAAIAAIHDSSYISYLESECRNLDALAKTRSGRAVTYPSVFPYGDSKRTGNAKGQAGLYAFDTYTPIQPGTFSAARQSADAALSGAEILSSGAEMAAYALTRPPGDHAEVARYGGYCYFNNSAIAAHHLSRWGKVAILDVDVHHGNGTQQIFYEREDLLTVSLHCHPDHLYPYFSGYADETGTGAGLGKNRNLPLMPDTDESAYQPVVETALDIIAAHRPAFLVVALGVDTHKADPVGRFALPTKYFTRLAATIAQLRLPTLIVQEGGYNLDYIGLAVAAFLLGIDMLCHRSKMAKPARDRQQRISAPQASLAM